MVYGPERFYSDKSSYTGVHKNGGPSTLDHNRVELSDLMDRSPADNRGVKLGTMSGSFRSKSMSGRSNLMKGSSGRNLADPGPSYSYQGGKDSMRTKSSKSLSPIRTSSSRNVANSGGGGALYGPERFFYDKSSYTGVHTKGGPSTIDPLNKLELKNIMDRSPADERGVKLAHGGGGMGMQRSPSRGQLMPLAHQPNYQPHYDEHLLSKGGSGMPRTKSGSTLAPRAGPGYGPERFFYDRSTFTGVHKNGGPSTSDNPRVELSSLMNRQRADVRGVNLGSYKM